MQFLTPNEFEKQQLAAHEERLRIHRLFEELSPEDLATLIALLRTIDQHPNPSSVAMYYIGNCVAIMKHKHNSCVCGVDHEAQERESLNLDAAKLEEERINSFYDKYGVVPLHDNDEDTRVMCLNCKTIYVSLVDRMVKEPNDCHGCRNKSAWG